RGRLLPALVAAAVVVALALGGWAAVLRQQLEDAAVVAAEESELLAAPDVRVVTIELPDGGRASYAVSREQDRAMLTAPVLPDPPEGRAYQLWTMQLDETGRPVAGTVEPHDVFTGGRDVRVFFDDLRGTDALAITVEDEAGATKPNQSTIFGIAPV
ncbi:anti-sigma factor, partial [Desertihabitans aurantiacus]|uniref:anti-sigma factor n=1 Tax=Desertihabitans aurantiacus TaxID=2282477 RepID=UPI0018E596D1